MDVVHCLLSFYTTVKRCSLRENNNGFIQIPRTDMVYEMENETDEDVPVSDYLDDSDFAEIKV